MTRKTNNEVLKKVAKDEPVFTLRAQDRLAPMLVLLWADLCATQHGKKSMKALEAYATAFEMLAWQRANRSKFPD